MATAGKVISCKAAVAWGLNKPLTIETIQVSPPQANEIRVKVLYGTVCQTDMRYMRAGDHESNFWPRIFGHEAAGVVESVGEGVTEFQEGDHVIPVYQGECNECHLCKPNVLETNMCTTTLNIHVGNGYMYADSKETRFSIDGKPIYHFFNISSFSEYTVVNKANLAKVNPQAPLEKIFLLGCGVSTGHGAVKRVAKVQPGSTVAVFGLGTIGLAAVQAAALSGASRIFGIDINSEKFPLAKEFGVTDPVNPREFDKPIEEVIKDMTGGLGVTYSFECVGGNMALIKSAIACVNPFIGTAAIIGGPKGNDILETNMYAIMLGVNIKGVLFGGYKGKTDVPKLVDSYMNKEFDLDKFITHELPLSNINEIIQMMDAGQCLRCRIDYSK